MCHWLKVFVCVLVACQGGDALFLPAVHITHVSKAMLAGLAVDSLTTGSSRPHLRQKVDFERRMGGASVDTESSTQTLTNGDSGTTETSLAGRAAVGRSSGNRSEGVPAVLQLFPSSERDWFGAEAECREWGGTLAIPDSQLKVARLRELLRRHNRQMGEESAAFLGFSDLEEEGYFVTVLGNPLFPSNQSEWSPYWFRADQPDDDKSWTKNGEDCGSLMPNGGLNDVPCGYKLPFICEMPRDNETMTQVEAIDDGDEAEGTLRFFPQPAKDWFSAKEACELWGGHLAIPDSEERVLKMAKTLISSKKNPDYSCAFLGFNDIEREGEFVTIFGKQVFNTNATWNPSWFSETQPDDNKDWSDDGEDCGSLHLSGGLNDVPCGYHLPYFCDKS